MAYKIKKNAGVWWPVSWDEAIDNGATETQHISIKFRRVGLTEAAELNKLASTGTLSMPDFFEKVAVDWDGPADETGRPLKFAADSRAQMLDVPGFPVALELAFWQMVGAVPGERAGNLNGSRETGPAAGEPTADQPASNAI